MVSIGDTFRLVDLSRAVKYEGAELDSCLLEEKVVGPVLPDDHDVDPTSEPAHLPVAPTTHHMAPGALTVIVSLLINANANQRSY